MNIIIIIIIIIIIYYYKWWLKNKLLWVEKQLKARQSCLLLQLFSGLVWMLLHHSLFF